MKRRYRVKVTRAGSIFVALTVILGVAAVNTGNNLLYLILSMMLSMMALSGFTSLLNLLGLEVRVRTAEEVYARRRVPFLLEVTNRKPIPSFLLFLRNQQERVTLAFLPPRGRSLLILGFTFPQRGWQSLPPIEVISSFPLGFFYRGYQEGDLGKCLVYPAPIPSPDPPLSLSQEKGERREGERERGQEGEFMGVRPFVAGDSFKAVHWWATARCSQLMVKEFGTSPPPPVLLTAQGEGDLERALGRMTFLAERFLRRGHPVGVKLSGLLITPASGEKQRRKILEALATYGGK